MQLCSITSVIAASVKIATTDLTCIRLHANNCYKSLAQVNYLHQEIKPGVFISILKRCMICNLLDRLKLRKLCELNQVIIY
jgi:hypothetical protein